MWDYNGDGVINSADDDAYWDDVYFEEHRDEYSPGFFGGGFSGNRSNNSTLSAKTTSKKNNNNSASSKTSSQVASGISDIIIGIFAIIGMIVVYACAGVLAFFGFCCMFWFPPLGILLMAPFYKLMGGR